MFDTDRIQDKRKDQGPFELGESPNIVREDSDLLRAQVVPSFALLQPHYKRFAATKIRCQNVCRVLVLMGGCGPIGA